MREGVEILGMLRKVGRGEFGNVGRVEKRME